MEQTVLITAYHATGNVAFSAGIEEANKFFSWLANEDGDTYRVVNANNLAIMIIRKHVTYATVKDSYFVQPNNELILKKTQINPFCGG